MWSQINVMHSTVGALKNKDIQSRRLAGLCATIKESCQAHTGITEATLYRDQAYHFYWIGKMIERPIKPRVYWMLVSPGPKNWATKMKMPMRTYLIGQAYYGLLADIKPTAARIRSECGLKKLPALFY